jgi:hypothetical protein
MQLHAPHLLATLSWAHACLSTNGLAKHMLQTFFFEENLRQISIIDRSNIRGAVRRLAASYLARSGPGQDQIDSVVSTVHGCVLRNCRALRARRGDDIAWF